jgi:16S rRNA (guanine527-N7)-methyltransferase
VKHHTDLNDLSEFMNRLNAPLSTRQYEQLGLYLELLNRWSKKINLVSRNDLPYLIERHFLPSLYLNACLPKNAKGQLMDLGSGAGFPGVLIAVMRPDLEVTLLDSSRKRTLFLEEVKETIGLDFQIVCQRCEQYAQAVVKKYNIVVSRAVANLKILLDWTHDLLDRPGFLYALTGGEKIDELKETILISKEYRIMSPGVEWIDLSNYMKNKFVIVVEK